MTYLSVGSSTASPSDGACWPAWCVARGEWCWCLLLVPPDALTGAAVRTSCGRARPACITAHPVMALPRHACTRDAKPALLLRAQDVFEIGRRYKIMNPDKMRSEFGKMVYMLMDSADEAVQVRALLVVLGCCGCFAAAAPRPRGASCARATQLDGAHERRCAARGARAGAATQLTAHTGAASCVQPHLAPPAAPALTPPRTRAARAAPQELLGFSCVRPLRTVAAFLEERGSLALLDDPLMEVCAGRG